MPRSNKIFGPCASQYHKPLLYWKWGLLEEGLIGSGAYWKGALLEVGLIKRGFIGSGAYWNGGLIGRGLIGRGGLIVRGTLLEVGAYW